MHRPISPHRIARAALAPTVLVSSILALLTTACGQQPVKVGVVLPLSGEYQSYGQSSQRGLELALAEIKATGDVRFVLDYADSASDPEKARQALARLYDEQALVAIGGITSGEAAAMVQVAEEAERVLISPSSTSDSLSQRAKYFYRLAPASTVAGNSLADFVRREYNVETAATVAEDEDLASGIGLGFTATLHSQGGQVVVSYVGGDFAEAGREIAKLRPDAVYLDGYPGAMAEVLRALRSAGYRGKVLATQALATPAALAELGELAVGLRYTTTALDTDHPPVADFVERYRAAYGEEPDLYAAEAYDTLKVLYTAMADRPSIPSSVRKGLRDEIKGYEGITGTLQFNESGSVNKYPKIYRVVEGLRTLDEKKWLEAEKQRIEDEKRRLREQLDKLRDQQSAVATTTLGAGS